MTRMRSPRSSGSGTRDPVWDASHSSGSSVSSAGSGSSATGSGRSRVRSAVRAIGSCFGSPRAADHHHHILLEEEEQQQLDSPSRTPSVNIHGSERKRSGKRLYVSRLNPSSKGSGDRTFTMADIQKATKNFSPSLVIGQGGFGTVYKGKLDDGTIVAIKRAKKNDNEGHLNSDFKREIQTMSLIEHLNLVKFLGYLEHGDEKIIVIDYVPNGTLREHLDCLHGNPLDLAARLDIAIDIAHAVTYLHMYTDHPIIHRDIKSSNILLTENLRAKVADFGFARLGSSENEFTHVSTQVKGTAGYLDPDYLQTYQLTEKSDVYSFGVLLVEMVTGRRPIEPKRESKERVTVKWAMKNFVEGNVEQTIDPNLPPNAAANFAVEKILELALQCLPPTRQSRPSMKTCAEFLWGIRKDYRELLSSHPLPHSSSLDSAKEEKN
ncbi:calmodulin-binding receptor-like cytoplasmic kinase 2 [Iris pallida]|uniref:non-specific serine/threonine protein kinase n=1 Tax=Iris pallida TaxID=29817 RepID=A0AAX6FYH0_IRIPA|nr:calmodulin-binding receptor-like cytoplasmic kinase 2 [Iris pallida]